MIILKKKNTVTIKDVAKKAGVAPSTVSRVISQNPRISKETSDRVLKCMKELGYYPNAIARSLANQKTGIVGVIMPTTSEDVFLNPFFPEALRGIAKGASKAGYDLLMSTNSEKDDELKIIQNFIRSSKVDGIILMSSKVEDECIDYLCSIDFPFSLIGTPNSNIDKINHIDNDNFLAAYELTKYLKTTGKNKIAMIAGDEKLTVTEQRVKGYKMALQDEGLNYNEELLFTGSFEEKTGHKYGSIIANLYPRPDAVIVTDDLVAFGVVNVFEKLNVKIPQDIAVASFNNSILSRYSNTPITSVDINAATLGFESMNLLVAAMEENMRGRKIITPYTIYKRKSTEINI